MRIPAALESLTARCTVWRSASLLVALSARANLRVSEDSPVLEARPTAPEKATLSQETREKLVRMGINPKYAGITDENELIALRAKDKN